jgi:hypothetical protein
MLMQLADTFRLFFAVAAAAALRNICEETLKKYQTTGK